MKKSIIRGLKIRFLFSVIGVALFFAPANALHFDQDTLNFTTLDELYYPGKKLKIWSDTAIQISTLGFNPGADVSWQYQSGKGIPYSLSAGETLTVLVYISSIRSAENPVVDSFAVLTNFSHFNYIPLHVGKFPHVLTTANTLAGPSQDTAGKNMQFTADSAYCSLRHKVHYSFQWDDRFYSPWLDTRTTVHSWSIPGTYNIRVTAKCDFNLSTGSQPSVIQIVKAGVNSTAGAYRSGFFTRAVDGTVLVIDFSQGMNPAIDSDLVFPRMSYSFNAPYGVSSLGIFDSFPTVISGFSNGFAPETSLVCRTYRPRMDSIIGSLHLIAPAASATASGTIASKQVFVITTKEGHVALVAKVGEYIGGIDREFFYWGYQSDGSRMFSPGVVPVQRGTVPQSMCSEADKIKILRKGGGIKVVLPENRQIQDVAVYRCNGSLVYRASGTILLAGTMALPLLPKGMYFVTVHTEIGRINFRLGIY